ncbi:MAG: magnesium transporter [Candidatus Asgardarchaeia archaeon]
MALIYDYKRIIKEGLPLMVVLVVFSLTSGNYLESISNYIVERRLYFFFVLPGYIDMMGDLGSVFVARLTSHIYVGDVDEKMRPLSIVFENIIAIYVVALISLLYLSFVTVALCNMLLDLSVDFFYIINVLFTSGFITITILIIVAIFATSFTYRKGLDPDNVTSPLMSNLGDLIGTILLASFILM